MEWPPAPPAQGAAMEWPPVPPAQGAAMVWPPAPPARGAATFGRPAERAVAAALRAAAARADAIVALSGAIARAHDPGGRRLGRTHMIHPGVDPPALGAARRAGRAAAGAGRSARSCRGSAPTSRSRSRRGSPTCSSTSPGRRCPATRRSSPRPSRERAAAPDLAGRVRLLGALPDPRTALRNAHVLLHCADREPYGLALVEALAAGRPVVAPAAGGPLEIVTPGSGRLYAPGDATAGAAALAAAARARPCAPAPAPAPPPSTATPPPAASPASRHAATTPDAFVAEAMRGDKLSDDFVAE